MNKRPRLRAMVSGLMCLTMASCAAPDPAAYTRDIAVRFANAPMMADALPDIAALVGLVSLRDQQNGGDGTAVLTLRDERFQELYRSLARSPDDFLEYQLRYDVHVELTRADGRMLWRDTIHTTEEYSQDSDELIGHIAGLEELRRQLVRQTAERVTRRVRAMLESREKR